MRTYLVHGPCTWRFGLPRFVPEPLDAARVLSTYHTYFCFAIESGCFPGTLQQPAPVMCKLASFLTSLLNKTLAWLWRSEYSCTCSLHTLKVLSGFISVSSARAASFASGVPNRNPCRIAWSHTVIHRLKLCRTSASCGHKFYAHRFVNRVSLQHELYEVLSLSLLLA